MGEWFCKPLPGTAEAQPGSWRDYPRFIRRTQSHEIREVRERVDGGPSGRARLTLSSYGSIVRKQLIPYFGKMSLSEIGYDQVQSFVHELAKEVSVKTLHNIVVCLRVMLVGKRGGSALKRGFLRHDPTRGVEMPATGSEADRPTHAGRGLEVGGCCRGTGWLRTRHGFPGHLHRASPERDPGSRIPRHRLDE